MKIGIISDTHLNKESIQNQSPIFIRFKEICEYFLKNVDLIIHLGDIQEIEVINFLSQIAPVEYVKGNGDIGKSFVLIPESKLIDIKEKLCIKTNFKIAISHQRSFLFPLVNEDNINIFLFGHSHIPIIEIDSKNRYWINPGAIKRPAGAIKKPSIALVEISEDLIIDAQIKYYEK